METRSRTQSSTSLDLEQALPVLTGSTTSRVVINNDLLRVVQFTFDAGQQLTEHSSPRAVVVQLISGKMIFIVDGIEHSMHGGDVVYLAPDAKHALRAVTACRMTLIMVETAA